MPFTALLGHRRLQGLLGGAVARGALPQSLIFAGPEGVGKRTLALALAQLLNCRQLVTTPASPDAAALDACGSCSSCRRIAHGTHPDVLTVPGDVSIDGIREVTSAAAFRPFEGRRRVFILDEADALSPAVQNALLKTLEEPTASSQFVLVTARPDMLLPTVRSRCPALRFGRVPVDDVGRWLVERHGIEPLRAREAAFVSEGSPGRALAEATGQSDATRTLAEQFVQEAASASAPARRLKLATVLLEPAERGGRGRPKGTRASSERELLRDRLDAVGAVLRDLGVAAAGGDDRWVARPAAPHVRALASRLGAGRLAEAYAAVGRARAALERNVSPKLVADWLALQL